ncbi:MAG: hypothetical protein BWY63_02846 [Chloroflexi bacterium ADurb.Bin360]|nr:MAG: hypothetical protein BWY63_02846 [Chloroflexi bacterium ADurb.Bin360]
MGDSDRSFFEGVAIAQLALPKRLGSCPTLRDVFDGGNVVFWRPVEVVLQRYGQVDPENASILTQVTFLEAEGLHLTA